MTKFNAHEKLKLILSRAKLQAILNVVESVLSSRPQFVWDFSYMLAAKNDCCVSYFVCLRRWWRWQCWRHGQRQQRKRRTMKLLLTRFSFVVQRVEVSMLLLNISLAKSNANKCETQYFCTVYVCSRTIRTHNCEIIFMKLLWLHFNPFDVWISLIEIDRFVCVRWTFMNFLLLFSFCHGMSMNFECLIELEKTE